MGQARVDRILLVWPRTIRRDQQPLSRKLDLVLMHRHASRLGAHLGIVTADDQIVDNAVELGLPVFDSVRDGHLFIWRSRRSLRPGFTPPPSDPPTIERAREQLAAQPSPSAYGPRHLARGAFFTTVGLLAATTLLLLTFPSAEVSLTPTKKRMTLEVLVTANPILTEPDYHNARIPAFTESTIVTDTIELPATGIRKLSTKASQGTVIFTNLSTQTIRIPAGTAVSTSIGTPVRFVTQQDVTLPANRGMITTAQVQAAIPGPTGNVKRALINRVQGPLNQRVAVTNRQPVTGGETITVPSVTQADRTQAYEALLSQLRLIGYASIAANLGPHQFSALETAKLQKVTETNYSHFVGDHADTLTLGMRATVTSSIANYHDVHQTTLHALKNTINTNMFLQEDTITYSISTAIAGKESGMITLGVTARANAIASIDPALIKRAARWKPVLEATQTLYESFPLTRPPTITITPNWLTRTPWLDWRTTVIFTSPAILNTNENIGG